MAWIATTSVRFEENAGWGQPHKGTVTRSFECPTFEEAFGMAVAAAFEMKSVSHGHLFNNGVMATFVENVNFSFTNTF